MCLPEERVAALSRKASVAQSKKKKRKSGAFADSGYSVTGYERKESEWDGEDKQASD